MKIKKPPILTMTASAIAGAAVMYFLHPNISPFPPDETALIREVVDTLKRNGKSQSATEGQTYGFQAAAGLARYEDRYSRLLSKAEAQKLDWVAQAGVGATGIEWRTVSGRSRVMSVRQDSAAARADIRPGDELLSVAGAHPFNVGTPLLALGQFPPGATVTVRMWRDADRAHRDHVLTLDKDTRSAVQLVSQSSEVAVIRVRHFDNRLESQLFELFSSQFGQVRPKSLVVDLRGQHGGLTDAARRFAAFFLNSGAVLARSNCADDTKKTVLIAQHSSGISQLKRQPQFEPTARWLQTVPLTILVDQLTFSAPEVFAAGLQDVGRATVSGERSGGKGLGQSAFMLRGGQQLWLTTCEYSTPSGGSIHSIGVVPNK